MKHLVFILLFFSISLIRSQNLITNPSFEDIDSCYGGASQLGFDVFEWSGCAGWSCPIASSSDLWCANPLIGVEPPNISGIGYQVPKTGFNMAGILINGGNIISYREFIQNELSSELINGNTYKLTFFHSPINTDCSTNQFGVYASTAKMDNQSVYFLSHLNPNGISNLNSFHGDTSLWNLVEIFFKANGGEKYLVIGNFQDSTNASHALPCDTSFWSGIQYAGNYFFLDDFSLEKVPSQLIIPNVFTPNDDGINDFFSPTVINYPNWKIEVINRWGNLVITLDENYPTWNGNDVTEGVYFYKFKSEELNTFKQGTISIIR